MSTATTGRAREYRVRDHLEDAGYPHIMRASGSRGAADLLHGHPFVGAILVQVGTGSKRLGPKERIRFLEAAALCHALPILATVIEQRGRPTEYRFHVVTHDKPSTWREWEVAS